MEQTIRKGRIVYSGYSPQHIIHQVQDESDKKIYNVNLSSKEVAAEKFHQEQRKLKAEGETIFDPPYACLRYWQEVEFYLDINGEAQLIGFEKPMKKVQENTKKTAEQVLQEHIGRDTMPIKRVDILKAMEAYAAQYRTPTVAEGEDWKEAVEKAAEAYAESECSAYTNDYNGFTAGAEWAREHFEQQLQSLQAENQRLREQLNNQTKTSQ